MSYEGMSYKFFCMILMVKNIENRNVVTIDDAQFLKLHFQRELILRKSSHIENNGHKDLFFLILV